MKGVGGPLIGLAILGPKRAGFGSGLDFRVSGFGSRVGSQVTGFGFRISGFGSRVSVSGLGFRL
jgi:hypothetical protein